MVAMVLGAGRIPGPGLRFGWREWGTPETESADEVAWSWPGGIGGPVGCRSGPGGRGVLGAAGGGGVRDLPARGWGVARRRKVAADRARWSGICGEVKVRGRAVRLHVSRELRRAGARPGGDSKLRCTL